MSARDLRAAESFKSAREAIGPIVAGMNIFRITHGQFSMIDIINHIISDVGPCPMSIWTWCAGDYELKTLHSLMSDGKITDCTLVMDDAGIRKIGWNRSDKRVVDIKTQFLSNWRDRFGASSIKICKNHAKIATFATSGGLKIVARGSVNLNLNARFEQIDVSEDAEIYDCVHSIEQALPDLDSSYTLDACSAASQTKPTFGAMSGLKTWRL